MNKIIFVLLLLLSSSAFSDELIKIPKGELKAIWLTPVAKKNQKNKTTILKIKPFEIMPFPVTIKDYNLFLKNNSEWARKNISKIYADETYLNEWSESQAMSLSPATQVSWFAARAFCHDRGMRLPSLNEWEYVAAASETKKDANNNPAFLKRILEWYGEPKKGQLKKVGSIYKNIYCIWDMHGLIWEWVEDFNSSFVSGESREDSSFNKDMFCGAGSLSMGDKENYAAFMRFAFRSSLKGTSSVWNLGFRCARDI